MPIQQQHVQPGARSALARQQTRLAKRLSGLKHHADMFPQRVSKLNPRDFHVAVLDTAAMWLDRNAATLLAAAMSAHLRAAHGEHPADHSQLLLRLLTRSESMFAVATSPKSPQDAANAGATSTDQSADSDAIGSEDSLAQRIDAAALWLDHIRLDTLSWLESELPTLHGLAQHVTQHCAEWFAIAIGSEPWTSLPQPFDSAPDLDKLLVAIALDSAHLHAALCWFARAQPHVYEQHSGLARSLCALQLLHAPPPALLHSDSAADPTEAVQVLASMHASGAVSAAYTDNSALSILSPRSGTRPNDEVERAAPVTTLHLHARVMRATLCKAVTAHAKQRSWLLLTCAHLRPDLVVAALQTLAEVQQNGGVHADFRLLFHCPTHALTRVPLRAQMQIVMLGGTYAVAPYVVQMLHAADTPPAASLHLAGSPEAAGLTRLEQATFQKLALAIVLSFATAAMLAAEPAAGALVLANAHAPVGAMSSVLRCLAVARRLVRGAESFRSLDFRQLRCAMLEVRCAFCCIPYLVLACPFDLIGLTRVRFDCD